MTSNRDYICFLSGLSAGVALALLLAPRSGNEVRKGVRDTLRAGQNLLREGRETLDKEKERIIAAVDAGKHAYHEFK